MKPFLLYSRMGSVTGRELGRALEISFGREVRRPKEVDTLIRWGHSSDPDLDGEIKERGGRVINMAENVSQSSNRHHMLQRLGNLAGASRLLVGHTLNFHNSPMLCRDALGQYTTTLLRHRYSRWGSDIVRLSDDVASSIHRTRFDGYFSVEYWPADHEVRVHIMDGKSICFQVKRQREGATPTETDGIMIRNLRNGWGLYPLDNDEARRLGIQKRPLREAAKLVCRHFGLTFAAVDFLVRTPTTAEPSRFDYKVLEINTSPGLEGTTLAKYTEALRAMLAGTNVEADATDGADTPPPPSPTIQGIDPNTIRRVGSSLGFGDLMDFYTGNR